MSQTTTKPQATWPRSLIDALTRQHSVVSELAELAQSQGGMIAENRTDRLLELLTRRQALIDQFTAAQSELGGLGQGLDRRIDALDPADRDRIRSLVAQIGDRLADVLKRDERDQASLRTARTEVGAELSVLSNARQAHSAYHGNRSIPTSSRYADQRG